MNQYLIYIATPFLTWFIAGLIKFLLNCCKAKKLTFNLIGYGGFPSNHSAIVSSTVSLIYFSKGISDSSLCVAITLAFIVFLDANSLRGALGRHALEINKINSKNKKFIRLKERIGHSKLEIICGAILGFFIGYSMNFFSNLLI